MMKGIFLLTFIELKNGTGQSKLREMAEASAALQQEA